MSDYGNKKRKFLNKFSALLISLLIPTLGFADASTIYKKVAPAVVEVRSWLPAPSDMAPKPVGSGSGVYVEPGLILTNCHILVGGRTFSLGRGEEKTTADLVRINIDADLCVLRPTRNNFMNAAPIPISEETISIGKRVYAVGNPRGLLKTLSEGIISGAREWDITGLGVWPKAKIIQTTASISPGSSGGGLYNENGELIGITTFSVGSEGNLNFAISAREIDSTISEDKYADIHWDSFGSRLNGLTHLTENYDPEIFYLLDKHRRVVFSLSATLDRNQSENFNHLTLEVARTYLSKFRNSVYEGNSNEAELERDLKIAFRWAMESASLDLAAPEPWIILGEISEHLQESEEQIAYFYRTAFERRDAFKNFDYAILNQLRKGLCEKGMPEKAMTYVSEKNEKMGLWSLDAACTPSGY